MIVKRILIKESLLKIEPYFFILCVLIAILPILTTKYYITLDGPSHLYNGNLIKELILGRHNLLSKLFEFNTIPVPNWSGHILIAFFNLLFPAYISEKILMLTYLILTPLFFRKTILYFSPENKLSTYFILPFLHNQLFYFGFFNMSLGIMLMFISTHYFLKKCNIKSVKSIVFLSLLLCLTFFSHIMLFLITVPLLVLLSFIFITIRKENNRIILVNTKKCKDRLLIIFLSSLPWLILSINYFFNIDSIEKQPRTDLTELLKWVIDIRPLLTICYCSHLMIFTHILFVLFGLLVLASLYYTIKDNVNKKNGFIFFMFDLSSSTIIWFFCWVFFLLLFFILPNSILLSERLILLFFIFFVCWLSLLKFPKWLQIISFFIVLIVQIRFVANHNYKIREDSENIEKIEVLANDIEPENLVLALNYSNNWLYYHSSGYIGANKPLAVLENFETTVAWFPLRWSKNNFVTDPMSHGVFSNKEFACNFFINKKDTTIFSLQQINGQIFPIKYVFQIGNDEPNHDQCLICTKRILNASYKLYRENNFCKLYILK